jgi:hypothetical protein
MGKHLIKYLVILIIVYGILIGGYYGFRKEIEGEKDPVNVLIEAGFEVSDGWAGDVFVEIENLEKNYIVQAYYFNTLIEKITNVDNDYEYEDFYSISPYGDVDYSLVEEFKEELKKQGERLNFLIGSKRLDKYAGGTKVIYID